jgi:hypothetical protein
MFERCRQVLTVSLLVFICVIVIALTVQCVNADSGNWAKTYGGSASDKAYSVVQTTEGYALIGTTNSFGSGLVNSWLIITDLNGNLMWNQTYNGIGQSIAVSLIQTADKGYAFAGYTYSLDEEGSGPYIWLAKTDFYGNLEWNQTYKDLGEAYAYSVIQTIDGGYALAGGYNVPSGGVEGWLCKIDSAGKLLWNRTYGESGNDQLNTVIQSSDGGYILGGSTASSSSGPYMLELIKTDSSGNVQWDHTYSELGEQDMSNVVETKDGGYAIFATSQDSGENLSDFSLAKTDSAGQVLWNQKYNGLNVDTELFGIQTSDGGYALTGVTNSSDPAFAKAWLVKTDSSGNIQWNQTYGGSEQNAALSISQTNDGGYVLGGWTNSTGAGAEDFWLVKTDSIGFVPELPNFFLVPILFFTCSIFLVLVIKKGFLRKI